jgi:hypothetical protein
MFWIANCFCLLLGCARETPTAIAYRCGESCFLTDVISIPGERWALAGSTGSLGESDLLLLIVESDGTPVLTRSYDYRMIDDLSSIVRLPDGGFLLAGTTSDSVFVNSIILLRTDSLGNPLSTRLWSEMSYQHIGRIIPVSDGYIVIGAAGFLMDTEALLIKLSLDFSLQWSRILHVGRNSWIRDGLTVVDEGVLIVAGSRGSDGQEAFAACLDSSGSIRWLTPLDAVYSSTGQAIQPAGDESWIVLAGVSPPGNHDLFLQKIGSDGSVEQSLQFGASSLIEFSKVLIGLPDGLLIAGNRFNASQTESSVLLAGFDDDLALMWQREYKPGRYASIEGGCMAPDGSLALAGNVSMPTDVFPKGAGLLIITDDVKYLPEEIVEIQLVTEYSILEID